MRILKSFLLLIILFAFVGCGEENINNSDELALNLNDAVISRDPVQLPANNIEQQYLDQNGFYLLSVSRPTDRYNNSLGILRNKVGISNAVNIVVEDDNRKNPIISGFAGGYAYHTFVAIDGKFIDILSEYSNYLAMSDLGQTFDSRVYAIDLIVQWHNSFFDGGVGIEYPLSGLSEQARSISDFYFQSLMGAILYHEFGHYYLLQALDQIRSQGTPVQSILNYTTINEDDADRISGMLTSKAGHSLSMAKEMIDLMAYYFLQRIGEVTSFSQIESSMQAQFVRFGPSHSSLARRKQLLEEGFDRFEKIKNN